MAARLRAMRDGGGASQPFATAGAAMMDAQAAIGLMSLEDVETNRRNNERLFGHYREGLRDIPGFRLVEPSGISRSNYHYAVCEVDEAAFGMERDALLAVLKAENINARRYFYPGTHRSIGYLDNPSGAPGKLPVTDRLCAECLQLPIGAPVDDEAVGKICDTLRRIQRHAPMLLAAFEEKAGE